MSHESGKRSWFKRYLKLKILIALFIVAGAFGWAINLNSNSGKSPISFKGADTSGVAAASNKSANTTQKKVGSTKTIEYSGNDAVSGILSVKLTSIIDTGSTVSGCGSEQGNKLVAVDFNVKNNMSISSSSGSMYDGYTFNDDAAQDVSVTGSDGTTYTPMISCDGSAKISACHSLVSPVEESGTETGVYSLDPTGTLTGCVPFLLPPSVSVSKVEFGADTATFAYKGFVDSSNSISLQETSELAVWTVR